MKIGIVFGGGAAKGAYQAGFMKSFFNYVSRDEIKAISSSSIGVLNGYALATNKIDRMYNFWKYCHFDNLFELMKSIYFQGYSKKIVNMFIEKGDFVDIPLYGGVTLFPILDYNVLKFHGQYNPEWRRFLRGAINFPPFMTPIHVFHKRLAFDGGLLDNIPLRPLMEKEDLDFILILHFQSLYKVPEIYRHGKTVILDLDVSYKNVFRKYMFDFSNRALNNMLSSGEDYGNEICSRLFKEGYTLDSIREECKLIYEEEEEYRLKYPTMSWILKANKINNTVFNYSNPYREFSPIRKKDKL